MFFDSLTAGDRVAWLALICGAMLIVLLVAALASPSEKTK